MKVLVAPDSFGGWRSASQIAIRMADRLRGAGHVAVVRPMSDGGEGLMDVLQYGSHLATTAWRESLGPLGMPRGGPIGHLPDGAPVVESSLWLKAALPSPWEASSAGLGAVLAPFCGSPAVVGLGGSSTVDMGLGSLAELGLHPLDRHGRRLPPLPRALPAIASFDGLPRDVSSWRIWADVLTPVTRGALEFGPQKGVSSSELTVLQQHWCTVARALQRWCSRSGRPPPPLDLPGGGAAGGLGFALAALGAQLELGVHATTELILGAELDRVDLLLTGEGRLDRTSASAKVVGWLSELCAARELPFAAVVGQRTATAPQLTGPVFVADRSADRTQAFECALEELLAYTSASPISARRSSRNA